MGHDIVRWGTRSAVFNDSDLWLLRHFALEALNEGSQTAARADLRRYFERWSWEAPGVYVGLELQEPAPVLRTLEDVLAAIRIRMTDFPGMIPASYLHEHVAPSLVTRWADFPVELLLRAVDQLESVALGGPAAVDSALADECPKCGGRLFHAVPGRTTTEEIRAFMAAAHMFSGTDAGGERDWIHPGTYCYACEFAVLATYGPPPSTTPIDERPLVLTMTAPGPNHVQVLLELRRALPLSPLEAIDLLKDGRPVSIERPSYARDAVGALARRFEELGATVVLSRKSPEE
jgi:hypothetical protein